MDRAGYFVIIPDRKRKLILVEHDLKRRWFRGSGRAMTV
jgi:hypothetical protein